ncbi:MAG: ribosome maturation factor RimM [Rhizobiaceae bacterium]|nr:ribosome maturation factor RimM [Rhizobiaceae bacterium]
MQLNNPVLMARIGGPHGIKGEVRVKPFGDDPLTLSEYGSLYSKDGRKFKITRMRVSKSVLVVKFKGVNFRDEAEALNGTDLYIDRSMLPNDIEDDEFYVTDLIDCRVVDPGGADIGAVLDVVNFGAGDLIEIMPSGSGQSILVEFTRNNVPSIDLDAKSIVVELPDEVSERDQ